jgi:hypothetical protein
MTDPAYVHPRLDLLVLLVVIAITCAVLIALDRRYR